MRVILEGQITMISVDVNRVFYALLTHNSDIKKASSR